MDWTFVARISASVATFGTLISLVLSLGSSKQGLAAWQSFVLALAVLLFIGDMIASFYEFMNRRPRRYKTKRAIRDYMYNWVSSGGRVAIFTRDMSWFDDDDMRQMLRGKAENHELTILLPKKIPVAIDLEARGANVFVYPQMDYVPRSRFTIINMSRDDASVAVGKTVNGVHQIEEFSRGSHPAFAFAEDLVEIVTRLNSNHP